MANTVLATFEHMGVTIGLKQDGRFYYNTEGNEVKVKDSLQEARESIKRANDAKEKTERVKLSLPCFIIEKGTKKLVPFVVTGVHAGHGKVTTSPGNSCDAYDDMYVDTEPAREATNRVLVTLQAYSKAQTELRKFTVSKSPGGYKCSHADGVAAIQEEHARKSKLK